MSWNVFEEINSVSAAMRNALAEAEEQAALDDGCVDDNLWEIIESLQMDREQKIVEVVKLIQSTEGAAAACKSKAEEIKARQKNYELRADVLRTRLSEMMQEGEKIVEPTIGTIYTKTSQSVDIDTSLAPASDEERAASPWFRSKTEYSPMKKEMLAAVKAGQSIPEWASIIEKRSLCVR